MKTKAITLFVDDALAHVESLLAATCGDDSKCAALRGFPGEGDGAADLTQEQRERLRRYVASWIEGPLRAARILLDEPRVTPWTLSDYANVIERSGDRSAFSAALAEAQSTGSPARFAEFVGETL